MRTYVEQSAAAAGERAARLVASRLRRAVSVRGRGSVAFSGGSTPAAMFDALTSTDVAWNLIDVFQVDERIAPDGDEERNATMLTDRLLRPARVPRSRTHLMPVTAADLTRACGRYATAVAAAAPLDVVHLGIGDDGHTASWPPGDPVIDSERTIDVSAEYQGLRRMTMTPAVVNAAAMRLVLVTEPSKADAMRRWINRDTTVPVSRVRRSNAVVVATYGVLP